MDEASTLLEIVKLAGGTSPLVGLMAWYLYNQKKGADKLAESFDKLKESTTNALHDVDKRLAVIENYVENAVKPQRRIGSNG